jgi:hypothetical protein
LRVLPPLCQQPHSCLAIFKEWFRGLLELPFILKA